MRELNVYHHELRPDEYAEFYLKSEADQVIAELQSDIADLRDDKKLTDAILDERNAEIVELKADKTFVFGEECEAYKKSEADKVIKELEESHKMEVEQLLMEIVELKSDIADLRDDKKSTDAILDERNAEIAKLQAIIEERDKTIAELQADYKEACDRLQTANLIKDEQMAKVAEQNQTISSLRCEVVDLERRVYAANRDARRTRY